MSVQADLQVDPGALVEVVRLALESPSAELGEWGLEPLHGGVQYESAIYRLSGEAKEAGRTRDWSLVLKVVRPSEHNADPGSYAYWKREAQVYQSGLPACLPPGLTAPRCYAIQDGPDGSVWMWLEAVASDLPVPWTMEQYAEVACRLGRVTGAFLTGFPQPSQPWLPRDWLRCYLENAAPMAEFLQNNPEHPLVKASLPGIALALTLAAWQERGRFLNVLEKLPQTFCHQDAFIRNLFVRGDQLVAIDWGFAGIAPLGSELAPLVGPINLTGMPGDQVRQQDRVCFDGYLRGLREAGWQGSPRQLRLGYTLSLVLRYVIGATVGETWQFILDKDKVDWLTNNIGKPKEQLEQSDPQAVAFFQGIMVEALRLMGIGAILRYLFRTLQWGIRLHRRRAVPAPA